MAPGFRRATHTFDRLQVRLRNFYTLAILFPLIPLAAIVGLGPEGHAAVTELPAGATAEWMYPRASVRGLAAYGLVVLWLLLELRRRPPAAFARLLWLAPILLTAASIVLLLPLALVYGEARELFAENSGVIGLRLVVRLAVGFGYVALLGFIRDQLLHTGALQPDE